MENNKIHNLKVNISNEDWEYLQEKAKDYNISASGIIEKFIKDLVYSNEVCGSDEKELANEWFSRNRFNFK